MPVISEISMISEISDDCFSYVTASCATGVLAVRTMTAGSCFAFVFNVCLVWFVVRSSSNSDACDVYL